MPLPASGLGRLESPAFPSFLTCCSKVTELDGNLERLKDRASKLTKSAKKYAQVLDGAALGTNGFADRWVLPGNVHLRARSRRICRRSVRQLPQAPTSPLEASPTCVTPP